MNCEFPYLSIHRVASLVNLSPETILKLIRKGDFPEGYKVQEKGILRFDPKKVEMWVREQCR